MGIATLNPSYGLGSVVHYLNIDGDVATFDDRGNLPTQPLTYLILASVHAAWVMAGMLEVEKCVISLGSGKTR